MTISEYQSQLTILNNERLILGMFFANTILHNTCKLLLRFLLLVGIIPSIKFCLQFEKTSYAVLVFWITVGTSVPAE